MQPLGLELAPGMVEAIVAHALEGFPNEVCGIIAGRQHRAVTLYRGRNVSPTPRVAYELDAETLALQIGFEQDHLELIGIYHSHPAGPATPSATDIELAFYPDAVYVICGMAELSRPSLRAFRIVSGMVSEEQIGVT